MAERLDVLDELGRRTGRSEDRTVVHREGLWHASFHCWLLLGDELVLQVRAASRPSWPGKLDATVGGHLLAGEHRLDGLREIEEEIGLVVTAEQLRHLGRVRIVNEGGRNREHCEVHLLARGDALDDLRFADGEVDGVVTIPAVRLGTVLEGHVVPVVRHRGRGCPSHVARDALVPFGPSYWRLLLPALLGYGAAVHG